MRMVRSKLVRLLDIRNFSTLYQPNLIGKSRVRHGGIYPAIYLNSSRSWRVGGERIPEDACSGKLNLTNTPETFWHDSSGMLERWRGLFKGNSKILSTSGRLFEKLEKRSWKFRLSGSVLAFPKTSLLETCLISFGTLHKFCQSGGKWRGYWKNLVHRIESVVVAVYETL